MAHIPKLVMDAIIDGTLPCLRNISWLNDTSGQFWASQYANSCTGGSDRATSHITEGPFWFRLHRCSASDIEQLNFFNNYEQAILYYSPPAEDYSLGAAVNIAVSEVYSYSKSPLDYTRQVQRSSRMFADSGVELMISYARNVTEFPIYQVNPSVYMKFFQPKVPVLILVGTYDANTENGLGAWFQEGLGSMATLLNVPYNSHVTFSYDNPCVNNIILDFFESLGTSYDASCLQDIPNPDWDGSSQEVQDYSYQLFGT
jgi:pimeloyl-ACP methyl ester carboxylesterase